MLLIHLQSVDASIGAKEALKHIAVGWFNLIWLVLVAVHDKCHAKGEDKDFAELVCLYKSSLHHKSIDGLHDAR